MTIPVSRDQYDDGVYYTNYYEGQDQNGAVRIPIKFRVQEDKKINTKKLRVTRDMKRAGSMRRRRRVAGSRAYIVGARFYHGNMLMSTGSLSARAQEQGMALRTRRDSSRVCL